MSLHNLSPAKGSVHSGKRIARGQGSGHGGTATRGHKGQKSRSGWSKKKNFEGGQMPLQQRLPKRGFKNPNRVEFVALNLGRAQEIADKFGLSEISVANLIENGIIKSSARVKLLSGGELSKGLSISVHACSKSAQEALEAKGGSINLV